MRSVRQDLEYEEDEERENYHFKVLLNVFHTVVVVLGETEVRGGILRGRE